MSEEKIDRDQLIGEMRADIAWMKKIQYISLALLATILFGVRVMDPTLLPWHWLP